MTRVTAQALYSHGKDNETRLSLQNCSEDWFRGCPADVLRQAVLSKGSSNHKCPVTDNGKMHVMDNC